MEEDAAAKSSLTRMKLCQAAFCRCISHPEVAYAPTNLFLIPIKILLIISSKCSTIFFSFVMLWVHSKAALVGELAVPCTCNPL